MSSLKKIICLANSWKLGERCIAGIDMDSGKWVRPVCDTLYPEDGRVPRSIRLIAGKEPELLDILEIPLSDQGNDFGFECENLSIVDGEWKLLGKLEKTELFKYCRNYNPILHNSSKYVNPSYLKSLPFHQRHTLQLIEVVSFTIESQTDSKGKIKWRGDLTSSQGKNLRGATITDPVLVEKLAQGYQPKQRCLVTVSLGIPYAPRSDWEGEEPCWKLIAGVIEL